MVQISTKQWLLLLPSIRTFTHWPVAPCYLASLSTGYVVLLAVVEIKSFNNLWSTMTIKNNTIIYRSTITVIIQLITVITSSVLPTSSLAQAGDQINRRSPWTQRSISEIWYDGELHWRSATLSSWGASSLWRIFSSAPWMELELLKTIVKIVLILSWGIAGCRSLKHRSSVRNHSA